MKTLIIMSAVPGAGKSTWARQYQATHKNVYIVSSDEVRKELTGQYQDFSRQNEVWEAFRQKIHQYGKIDNCIVILDAVIDKNSLREFYVKETPEFDFHVLVVIQKPWHVLLKQNKQRNEEKWVPDEVMEKMYKNFETPTNEVLQLFDEYRVINEWFKSDKVIPGE